MTIGAESAVDYGCGKGLLKKNLRIACTNYDPAVPEFSALPHPADLVVCTDVLEHIEPERLDSVLTHLRQLGRKGLYAVIATRPDSSKLLADGTNPHKIIKTARWWHDRLASAWGELRGTKQVVPGEYYLMLDWR